MNPSNAALYNINLRQNKLYDKTFTWTINGVAVNLTGYTATLKAWDATKAVILSLSTTLDGSGNGIILGGAAGTVEIVIKSAKTGALTTSQLNYELYLTRADGENIPFFTGTVSITPEIS